VRVAVTIGDQTSAVETVKVNPVSPGVFAPNGRAAALRGLTFSDLVTPANPARRGEAIVLFATGLGDTSPPAIDGEPAPFDVFSRTTGPVVVELGGVASQDVFFSGLAPGFSGLFQINFFVPPNAPVGNEIPVQVRIGDLDNAGATLQPKLAVQ
jgi:uncharacterized protein (TIGR03437 family)